MGELSKEHRLRAALERLLAIVYMTGEDCSFEWWAKAVGAIREAEEIIRLTKYDWD
jgi:hypothetical protein